MATATLSPNPEQRRLAVQLSEKARQAINALNFDYGIALLQDCCKLDPAGIVFRKALRQTMKLKYENNLTGSPAFGLTTWGKRMRLRTALQRKQYAQVLELGEAILAKNPWHTPTQLLMAQAAEKLELTETAVFILDQARQKNPNDPKVNLPAAQLHERLGNYAQAVLLYELVTKADPTDATSARKIKDLSATAALRQGKYEDRTFNPGEDGKPAAPLHKQPQPLSSPIQQKLNEMDSLRARIQAEPTNPHLYLELAKHYKKDHKWEDARTVLEQGLAASGSNFEISLAIVDLEIEPFRANLAVAQKQLDEQPQNAQFRTQAAQLNREVLARETAYYRQRADRYPSDHVARLELGVRLTQLGQPDEAIPELQQGRKDTRNRWKALVYLGHAFRQKRNWPLAKRNYEEGLLALPPGDDDLLNDLLFNLSKGAADAGDWPTAIQHGNELANRDYAFRGIGELVEQWNRKLQGAEV